MDRETFSDLLYPDVLGTITGGSRIALGDLHMALGLFPRRTYINQPFEAVIVLQNLVDQPMEVKVALQLPNRDSEGRTVALITPKRMTSVNLRPAEVGVLRMPIIAVPPTQQASGLPVRVAVRQRTRPGKIVRSTANGAPPARLAVSPYKLHVLREVEFAEHRWDRTPESVAITFDIAARRLPAPPKDLQIKYEVLWTLDQWAEERPLVLNQISLARSLATEMTRSVVYGPFMAAVDERYTARGLPLQAGEARLIAKMLTYTVDEGMSADEEGIQLEESRWFHTLCQVLAYDESIADADPAWIAEHYLFDAILHDAARLAFDMVLARVRTDLGDRKAREEHVEKLLQWLAGQVEPDLRYIYLPLMLGGLAVNYVVTVRDENPWDVLDEARDAHRYRLRTKTKNSAMNEITPLFDKLVARAEDDLRRSRVQR